MTFRSGSQHPRYPNAPFSNQGALNPSLYVKSLSKKKEEFLTIILSSNSDKIPPQRRHLPARWELDLMRANMAVLSVIEQSPSQACYSWSGFISPLHWSYSYRMIRYSGFPVWLTVVSMVVESAKQLAFTVHSRFQASTHHNLFPVRHVIFVFQHLVNSSWEI